MSRPGEIDRPQSLLIAGYHSVEPPTIKQAIIIQDRPSDRPIGTWVSMGVQRCGQWQLRSPLDRFDRPGCVNRRRNICWFRGCKPMELQVMG